MSRTNPRKIPPVAVAPNSEAETTALSNEQRLELVEKARGGNITAGGTELLARDIGRAAKKAQLASHQAAHPNEPPQGVVYDDPAISAASATDSLSQMVGAVVGIAVKHKLDREHCATQGGNKQKEKAASKHKRVVAAALRLRQDGAPDHKLASQVRDRYGIDLTDRQIRTILQNNGVLNPPTKRK